MRAAAALDTLEHRGPDDRGTWTADGIWLGTRRLAILDLTAAGHQPMVDTRTGNVLTFNGEVYNYVELRRELERAGRQFESGTDTEVVLAAYAQWGRDCVRRFNGMWGFALWDAAARSLFFSRDRFGVKPLYYAVRPDRLTIASEPKALLALDGSLRAVDETALYRFLVLGELYGRNRSFYEGIRVVPPGHSGSFSPGDDQPTFERYWDGGDDSSVPSPVDRFTELLDDAVRIRLRSDVPVGLTLSGGLDSTAILGAAARQMRHGRVAAFNARAETPGSPGDESAWARRAAEIHDADLRTVIANDSEWHATMRRIAWYMDAPGYSPAVYPLWHIMKEARASGVKVLLEGQGADELLGGYTQHVAFQILGLARRGRLLRAAGSVKTASASFSTPALYGWLARATLPSLASTYRRRSGLGCVLRPDFVERVDDRWAPPEPRTLDERLERDFARDVLPGLLHYGDAISMAHSVESRLPFLDYRLVSFCQRLPDAWKVHGGETKVILRRHLAAQGLVDFAARRDKVGFVTPVGRWLTAGHGATSRALLLDPNACILEYCQADAVSRLIDTASRGNGIALNHVYRLASTELWLRACVNPAR